LFVAIFVLLTIPTHFFNLGFISLLAQAVSEKNRASAFAARNMISGAMLSLCNFLFGIWLGRVAFPVNYQALFLFAFAMSLVSLYYLRKVNTSEVPRVRVADATTPFWKAVARQWYGFFSKAWKVRGFTQITINTFLYGIGIWAATPLLLLYFVRTLGASEGWLGVFGSVGSLATIVGYLFWRRIIARWGEPKTLQWTIVGMGLYPLLAGSIPSLTAILFVAALNGVITAGVTLSHFNTFLKVIPEDERHNYTALHLTLMNVGAFICPLIGIALANRYGFAPVLIACGVLSIIGSTSFWIWPLGESRPSESASMPEVVKAGELD
jgi:Na+/melibiose symporter-like transporter